MSPRNIKLTVVGDGLVGKTCLLFTYVHHQFPETYVPTVFDNYTKVTEIDGQPVELNLWDTAGQEDYERLRPLSYPNTDCFLLCFAVDNHTTYTNVELKWYQELRHHCPLTPILLVGTKSDARAVTSECVTLQQAKKMKRKIEAEDYIECSALKTQNLDEVFDTAMRIALKGRKKKQRTCNFL